MSLEVTDITPLGVLDPVGRAVLVVIDVLGHEVANPYAGEKGPMAGRESRNAAIAALTDSCRQKNVPVVFIQEQHKPEGTDIGRELDGAEGMHCIEGSPDSQLYPGLNPTADEYVIVKRRYSAFFGTPLEIILKGYHAQTVLLVGELTDICVHYTAVDAHQLDYRFRVITDMLTGSTPRAHEAALRAMKYLQRDALVTSKAVADWLDSKPLVA